MAVVKLTGKEGIANAPADISKKFLQAYGAYFCHLLYKRLETRTTLLNAGIVGFVGDPMMDSPKNAPSFTLTDEMAVR
eukprot:CAMPEP_0197853010 /NCGR_PEP_ID=MMETSP1438-20131217/21927_1 /TAXON_ID=1461541 /ORGANISM="Pterosperma sp., Strain CCMP1384" /LENGTH=77 /DNA_ID=CAMNT_0043467273 /DNA_START=18 /DNA_END=247 /DNA_ORIENTATION=-